MSSASTSITSTVPHHQCSSRSETDGNLPCNRRVAWYISKVGYKCNLHFERYFDAHWKTTPVDSIRRLSDNDKDFSEYKPNGNGGGGGGRPKKIQVQVTAAASASGT